MTVAKLDNFEELEDFMQGLGEKAAGVMQVATKEAAQFCVKILKEKSRALFGNGKYSKGWKFQKNPTGYTVYNKYYQLVHLLEKGYTVKDRNGVSHGDVAGRPHLAPAERETDKFLVEKTQEGLSNSWSDYIRHGNR